MDAGGAQQHLGNGISPSFRTASDGVWTFTSLPPGRYRLEVSRSGSTTHSEVLDLTAVPPFARTVTLPLGASAFKLDVVDTTPLGGVRGNQPFGDVVSWDLIPRVAISEATMMPGSNPLFGLNTLGGALCV